MATHDSYSRLPVYWAASVALISEILYRTVDFWPLPGPQYSIAGPARGLLDVFLRPIVTLTIFVFLVCLVIVLGFALIRRHFRKALSFASALGAVVLILVIANLPVFDPYFWYVLCNKTRLEETANVMMAAQARHFAVVEDWDVSTGLAIDPPTFVSIVHDQSGEIDQDEQRWSPAMRTLYERDILHSYSCNQCIIDHVEHVFDHFFVVWVTTR
jgi:hypothetical protein